LAKLSVAFLASEVPNPQVPDALPELNTLVETDRLMLQVQE
jgi:hypothetical protein